MKIIGVKYYGHDAAVCEIDLVRKKIRAESLERMTRIKHDAILCDEFLKCWDVMDADIVAHSFNEFSQLDTCIETKAIGLWGAKVDSLKRKLYSPKFISELKSIKVEDFHQKASSEVPDNVAMLLNEKNEIEKDYAIKPASLVNFERIEEHIGQAIKNSGSRAIIEFHDHHLCHAVSAYFPSVHHGKESLVITLDGQGDGFFSKAYIFNGHSYECIGGSRVQLTSSGKLASIGHLYSAFTEALGFTPNSDEGKVEALAAFGQPIPNILYQLNKATFIFNNSIAYNVEEIDLFLDVPRLMKMFEEYDSKDLAATIQKYLEDTVVAYINSINTPIKIDRIALAGGVAANIIMSLAIFERTEYKKIHVCPYMGDEGTALGAALLAALRRGIDISWISQENMPYWGPQYDRKDVLDVLSKFNDLIEFSDMADKWESDAAQSLSENKIIAVFASRMEFGPRALGNRSILANPADPALREKLNVSVKRRPPWQPFCPSILSSERERLFIDSFDHKHMAIAFRVREEHIPNIPSAVHVDGTARPQFVSEFDNPHFFKILSEMKRLSGYGVVINTSFNLHGRTIVRTPNDAVNDFIDCNLDVLYIEGYKVCRSNRDTAGDEG